MTTHARWRAGAIKLAAVTALSLAVTAGLAGCAGGTPSSAASATPAVSAADIAAALQKPTTITIWTWAKTLTGIVSAFEAKYPKITVNVVNVGSGTAHYTKFENAIKAGTGAPDLATVEYSVLPQFAVERSLVDLKKFGYESLSAVYTPSVWNSVNVNGGLYELPHNAGPMALFYNKTVFDKFGINVPTTWEEYAADAAKIHAADPTVYLAADAGDVGFTNSMMWAAGGMSFQTSGTSDVTINMHNNAVKKFTDFYNPLIQNKLLAPVPGFSSEWYQGLANGKIASLVTGAWMVGSLESGVPTGAGDWRAAPLPTYSAGDKASAVNGGGGYAMLKQSSTQHQLVSAGFLKFMDDGPGIALSIQAGQFPSTVADLTSPKFLNAKNNYFGGQEVNKVFAQSAKNVLPGWQYLPYQSYANSIFNDYVGKAYTGKGSLSDGLNAWGDALKTYGNQQGFTVK